jgi:hypothetical protein
MNEFETPKIENENLPLIMDSFSIKSPAVFNPEIPEIKIPASNFHFEIPKINPPKIEIPTPKIEIHAYDFSKISSGEEFSEKLKSDERYQKIKAEEGSKNPFGAFSDFVYEKGIDFQTSDFWVDTVDKFTSFSNKVSEWSEGWSDEINKQVTGWKEDLDQKKEGWDEWVKEDSARAFWLDPIGQRYFNLVDSGAEIYQKFLKATDYTGTARDIQKLVGKITAGKIERDTSYRNNWATSSRLEGKQKLTMNDLLKRKKKEDDENLEDLKKKILSSEDSTEEKKEEEKVEEKKEELKEETKSVTPYTPNIDVEGKSLKDILIDQKVKSGLTIEPNLDSSVVEKAKLYEFIGEKILSELEAQLDYFIMWFTEGSDLNQLSIPVKSMDNNKERRYYYYFYINEISFKPFVKSTMDLKYYPIKTITSNYSKVKNNNEFTIKTSYDIALSFYDFIVDKCMGFNLKEGIIGSRRGNGYNFSRTEGSDFEKSKIDLHVLIPSKSGLNNETKKIVYFANHFILKDIRFSGLDRLSFAHSSTSPFSASIRGVFRKAILIQNEKIGEGTNENARKSDENNTEKTVDFGEKVLNRTESKGIQDDKFIHHFFNTTGVNTVDSVIESTGLKIEPDVLNPVYSSTRMV